MANILFKKGSYNDFKTKILADKKNIVDGALYLTEDEGGLYLGKNTTTGTTEGTLTRIQGSVIIYESVNAFTNSVQPPYSSDVIYFITANNALIRWDPNLKDSGGNVIGGWIQLNPSQDGIIADIGTLQATVNNHGDQLEKALFKEGDGTTSNPKIVNVDSHKLTNVVDPTSNQDAATKKYVDNTKTTLLGATTDATSAETIRGVKKYAQSVLGNTNSQSTEMSVYGVKKYAEAVSSVADAAKGIADKSILKDGTVAMEANLSMQKSGGTAYKIINLKDPDSDQDAATKKYVDTAESNLLGTTSDATSAETIRGVKKYANTILGNTNSQSTEMSVYGVKKYAEAVSGVADSAKEIADKAILKDGTVAMAADLGMGGHSIKNLADLTSSSSGSMAANKNYVDNTKTALLGTTADASQETIKGVKKYAQDIFGTDSDDKDDITVKGNHAYIVAVDAVADAANTRANNALLKDGTEAMTGALNMDSHKITNVTNPTSNQDAATKIYVDNTKSSLLGTTSDTTDKETIRGVKKYAESVLGTSSDAKTKNTVYGVKAYANEIAAVANDALSKTNGGTVTGNTTFDGQVTHNSSLLVKGTNIVLTSKTENGTTTNARILGLVTPTDNSEATNKSYVDTTIANAIKANDAMTFKGTLGTNGTISSLPTTATVYSSTSSNPLYNQKPQRGDTFKVVTAGTYAGTAAKVGDIFINAGADDGVPSWTHIAAGYEANYNQRLVGDVTNKKVYLTDGLGTAATNSVGSLTIVSNNDNIGVAFEATGTDTTVTLSMTWGSF